jgi:hypothetical protein
MSSFIVECSCMQTNFSHKEHRMNSKAQAEMIRNIHNTETGHSASISVE